MHPASIYPLVIAQCNACDLLAIHSQKPQGGIKVCTLYGYMSPCSVVGRNITPMIFEDLFVGLVDTMFHARHKGAHLNAFSPVSSWRRFMERNSHAPDMPYQRKTVGGQDMRRIMIHAAT